jgi:hypothetical protein
MCITVEKAHISSLAKTFQSSIERLIADAPNRAKDFILELEPKIAPAAIVFRDFPKLHGNIVQNAVGVALSSHKGGYSETEKKFQFLSSPTISVDNFFLHSSGQIYLFETKRNMQTVRQDAAEASARKLDHVATDISTRVKTRTGRPLRHAIRCIFFSFVDEHSPGELACNVGSGFAPKTINMPIYGRAEMNGLIGECFGQYIANFDDMIARLVSEKIPELCRKREKALSDNPLYDLLHGGEKEISMGGDECKQAEEDQVLAA